MTFNERLQVFWLIVTVAIAGCLLEQKHIDPSPQATSSRISEKTADRADWLTICGSVTTAFGVASFIAGQSRGITIASAGIILVSLGLLITFAVSTLIEYRQYFVIAFLLLLILGFFTFFRSVADVNRDGKVDWQDLKALIFKIKHQPKTP